MAKYEVCERCGAHVDPGEKCRCVEERQKEIEVRRSDTGLFFMYNAGGRRSLDTIGRAQVLAGKKGEPLKSYAKIRDVNGNHALCRVQEGCYVVHVKEFHFGWPNINIYRIERFEQRETGCYAVCWKIYREYAESREYWDTPVETVKMLWDAVEAAVNTAETVMCRKSYYIKTEDP